jgi:hypothetical protein
MKFGITHNFSRMLHIFACASSAGILEIHEQITEATFQRV